ncbi:hypothetical protein PAXRUDRAFT_825513 [Paxillus rubicundulus Ve08.2h10]|uniref:Uncharacterized protein n=1 Tax=Paxillus rubicundulus Ve08.2h10 TaxID=930991 RepID=A0A0D0E0H5_9AGAM|nr:hypothetical protein PAXRUDRAFT_825513 [Paxillus rubicundulus Ve08.2h10]
MLAHTTIAQRILVSTPCQATCPQQPAYTPCDPPTDQNAPLIAQNQYFTYPPSNETSCIRYVNYLSPITTASQGTVSASLWLSGHQLSKSARTPSDH